MWRVAGDAGAQRDREHQEGEAQRPSDLAPVGDGTSGDAIDQEADRDAESDEDEVEDDEEVIEEGEDKEDALADLALIGAAQRVEHYEISGYTTVKNLAQQLRHSAVVALLSKSLAEEENADQLLNQIGRSLMSVAKMPDAIEQSEEA